MFHRFSRLLRLAFTGGAALTLLASTARAAVVTNTDPSGPGSFAQAVADTPDGGDVTFAGSFNSGPQRIIELPSEVTLNKSISIFGPGAKLLRIVPSPGGRHFRIFGSHQFRLYSVTLSGGGEAQPGGGVQSSGPLVISECWFQNIHTTGQGGAISAGGSLLIERTLFENNSAAVNGGALATRLMAQGNVLNCMFIGNQAPQGAALYHLSAHPQPVRVENCSFTRNAGARGSALMAASALELLHCTVVQNTSTAGAALESNFVSALTLSHLAAGENTGPRGDVWANVSAGSDHNVLGTTADVVAGQPFDLTHGVNGNVLGASALRLSPPVPGVLSHVPQLLLMPDSPLLNAGASGAGPGLPQDARNVSRPVGGLRDAGAVERAFALSIALPAGAAQQSYTSPAPVHDDTAPTAFYTLSSGRLPAGLVFDTNSGTINGTPLEYGAWPVTITRRNVFDTAEAADGTITINAPPPLVVTNGDDSGPGSLRATLKDALPGSLIHFAPEVRTVTLSSDQLSITRSMMVDGGRAGVIITRAAGARDFRIMETYSGTQVTLQNLTFRGGRTVQGGGLQVLGEANVSGCSFVENSTLSAQGMAAQVNGRATFSNCTFAGNTGPSNASLLEFFYATEVSDLVNCTLAGTGSGGIAVSSGAGFARLRNCVIFGHAISCFTGSAPAGTDYNVIVGPASISLQEAGGANRFFPAGTDLRLLPLRSYGSSMPVLMPLRDSPLLNTGTLELAPPRDQLGAQRPVGQGVEAGAVELQAGVTADLPVGVPALVELTPVQFSVPGTAPGSRVFSILEGALPPGLILSAAGELSGIPAQGGTYGFIILALASDGSASTGIFSLEVGTRHLVTHTGDSGPGSLRATIAAANSYDTIGFEPSVFSFQQQTIELESEIPIVRSVKLEGTSQYFLRLRSKVDARCFHITPGGSLDVREIMFLPSTHTERRGGIRAEGPLTAFRCIFDGCATSGGDGGAIHSTGSTVTLSDCLLAANAAPAGKGGAVYAHGSLLSISGCHFSANQAFTGGAVHHLNEVCEISGCSFLNNLCTVQGGAVWTDGALRMSNSTLHANSSGNTGGALHAGNAANGNRPALTNCTISGNQSANVGSALYLEDSVTLVNCAIGENNGTALAPEVYFSGGLGSAAGSRFNCFSQSTVDGLTHGSDGNQMSVASLRLTAPAHYDRLTAVMIPRTGSPLLESGTLSGAPSTDQRGVPRPQHGATEIGAVEHAILPAPLHIQGQTGSAVGPVALTATGGTAPYTWQLIGDGLPAGLILEPVNGLISGVPTTAVATSCEVLAVDANGLAGAGAITITITGVSRVQNADDSGPGSLRQVLADTVAGGSVAFDPVFFGSPRVIALNSALTVTKNVRISGTGAQQLTLQGAGNEPVFNVSSSGLNFILENVRLTGPAVTTLVNNTGGIYFQSTGGVLTLRNSHLTGPGPNLALVYVAGGALTLERCTLSGPSVAHGLFLQSVPSALLVNSTFHHFAVSGVDQRGATTSVTSVNCSFIGNRIGWGLQGGSLPGTAILRNNLFAGNFQSAVYNADNLGTVTSQGGNISSQAVPFVMQPSDSVIPDLTTGPLDYYGGQVPVCMPYGNSSAVDHGVTAGAPEDDQRGILRPSGTGPDSGSVEVAMRILVPSPLPTGLTGETLPPIALGISGDGGGVTFAATQPLPDGLTISPEGIISGTPLTAGPLQPVQVRAVDATGQIALAQFTLSIGAQLLVTSGNDSGSGSLRATVAAAPPHSVIRFASTVNAVNITSGTLGVDKPLFIDGGEGGVRIMKSGTGNYVLVWASGGLLCTFHRISFEGGTRNSDGVAGFFSNNTPVAFYSCLFTGNYNQTYSTIVSGAPLSFTNCTITGNGGTYAISLGGSGHRFTNCTITGNSGGAFVANPGSDPRLTNTIVYGNNTGSAAEDHSFGSPVHASSTGNLVSSTSSGGLLHGANGNKTVPPKQNIGLLAAGSYGGPLPTCLLAANSPAANAAMLASAPAQDARGIARPQGLLPDMGAVESSMDITGIVPVVTRYDALSPITFSCTSGTGPWTYALASGTLPAGLIWDAPTATLSGTPEQVGVFPLILTVTDSTGLSGARLINFTVLPQLTVAHGGDSGPLSLRDVIASARDGDVITFAPTVTEVQLSSTVINTGSKRLTLDGGATGVSIRRTGGTLAFIYTGFNSSITLRRLWIRNFNAISTASAVQVFGHLNMEQCTFSGNGPSSNGVVFATGSSIRNCTFAENNGASVLALYTSAYHEVIHCTFRNNGSGIFVEQSQTVRLHDTWIGAGGNYAVTGQPLHPDSSGNVIESQFPPPGLTHGVQGNLLLPYQTLPPVLPLGQFGGPVPTCLIGSDNPGVDHAVDSLGTLHDQRGVARPQGIASDTGATETALRVSGSPVNGVRNLPYPGTTFSVTGGSAPYTWSLAGGALPAGLTLDPATGVLSGTPTTAQTADFGILATDSLGRNGGIMRRMEIFANGTAQLVVTGNGSVIANGSSSPSLDNHTDFGSQFVVTGTVSRTFTLTNTGTAELTLGGFNLSGTHATDFSVTQPYNNSTIPIGGSTSITLTFNPSAPGVRSAQGSFNNNMPGGSPFVFAIRGTGLDSATVTMLGNGQSIPNGSTAPATANHTDFGSLNVDAPSPATRTFTIQNTGTVPLHLGTLSLSGAASFSFTQPLAASVAPAGSTTFTVSFDPATTGPAAATVSIPNNDPQRNPFTFAIQGTGAVEPQLTVRGDGQVITNGDSTPVTTDHTLFPSVNYLSGTTTRTYTIENTGNGPLQPGPVTFNGANAADFTTTEPPPASVPPGGSATFTVTFNPSAAGVRNATLQLPTNDPAASVFMFAVRGTGLAQDIAVSGNSTSITDGDTSPSTTDHTDFGSTGYGSAVDGVVRNFVISNAGSDVLTLGAVTFSGTDPGNFTALNTPPAALNPGAAFTLQVAFRPFSSGQLNATLNIASNDPDENPFNFNLRGTGTAAPEITVTGNSQPILSGSTTPALANHTDFGTVNPTSGTVVRTFTIRNTGSSNLTLGTPQKTGTGASRFTINTNPATSLAAGASTTLVITYDPNAVAINDATISITTNDPTENPFTFAIRGTGAVPAPEIDLTGNGLSIPDGDTTPATADHTDFGSTALPGGTIARTFTILNTGTASLTVGTPVLSGTGAAAFSLTTAPAASVPAGGSTSFTLTFAPAAAGLHEAALSISNNDTSENPYNFSLRATATPPPGPPELLATTLTPDGRQALTLRTLPGVTYQIHVSTDLLTFTLLTTLPGDGSDQTWTDPAPAAARRFYKVVIP